MQQLCSMRDLQKHKCCSCLYDWGMDLGELTLAFFVEYKLLDIFGLKKITTNIKFIRKTDSHYI